MKNVIKGHAISLLTQLHEMRCCEVPVDGLVIGLKGCFWLFLKGVGGSLRAVSFIEERGLGVGM